MRVRQENGSWLEFNRIDSVERVYKVLREFLDADVRVNMIFYTKINTKIETY